MPPKRARASPEIKTYLGDRYRHLDPTTISPTMSFEDLRDYALQTLSILTCGALGFSGHDEIEEQTWEEKAPLLEEKTPSPRKILVAALEVAQRAVEFDKDGLVPEAVQDYVRTVSLLNDVLRAIEGEDQGTPRSSASEQEIERIKVIRDTYDERVRVLVLISDL